jgi:N-acetylglucosamine kinase-like BadF-type ATPase
MRRSGVNRYCIGMDCGGTTTRAVLADAKARILARAKIGSGNPMSAGLRVASRSYELAVHRLLRRAGLRPNAIAAVAVGAAGAGRPAERRRIAATLRRLAPRARISVDTDAGIALYGATMGKPGILVIAGTGSIVLGMGDDGRLVRAGGWGFLLGDEGSGSALGREAVKAVLRAEDGREPRTRLRSAVLRHFRVRTLSRMVALIYHRPPSSREYAMLWPELLAAASHGDRVARAILRSGGEQLAETVEAVAARLVFSGTIPLILSGGVLSCDSLLRRTMLRRLRSSLPRARVTDAVLPPDEGALLKAIALISPRRAPRKC